ncbi:MAG: sigma-70 family RNA polymerase sigma factor [Bacteroidetes bacterium]|nr:sigma-70 family RNA polymerase sigma factor [Bacteroidota bacterium]MBK9411920.1 sigma-70 family RNA polymerase sigma factor [Bacteroidota bacterium]
MKAYPIKVIDVEQWDKLIHEIRPIIKRAIRKTVFNLCKEDGQDLEQEILLKIYSKIHLFNPKLSFNDWVYILSVNHSIDFNRKKLKVKESPMNETTCESSPTENLSDKNLLRELLSKVSSKYRNFIYEKYIAGFKQREIAARHQLPIGTVSGRIQKGILQLKKLIKEEGLNHQDF